MRKFILPITTIVLFTGFAVYANSGFRLQGPADKAVQFLILLPAVLAFALWGARTFKIDPVKKVLSGAGNVSTGAFVATVLLFVLLFTLFMATGPLEGIPKGGDEAAYLFQSRIFAAGETAAPIPEVDCPRDLFPFRHFIFREGQWFVMYTPMHSLLMAPFTAVSLSFLMGPLESIIALLGAFLLMRRLAGEKTARLGTVVMALSPYFLFMSSSHMAHNTSLLFVTWALYFLVRGIQEKSLLNQLFCGFLLGLALNTKPYPIMPWSITITLVLFVKLRRDAIPVLLRIAAGALLPVGFFLISNNHYSGNPLSPAYNLARGGGLMGFGENRAWFPEYGDHAHTPFRGLLNVLKQAGAGSTILLGWPFLSLIPACAILLDRKLRKRTWPLYTAILMIVPFMFIHYCSAIDYGPRHYYTALPAFVLLTAAGFSVLVKKWGKRASLTIAGLYVVSTLMVYIPDGIRLRSRPWQTVDSVPVELARREVAPPAVVFMEASEHGYPNIMSGLLATDPFLNGEIIFCAHQTAGEDMEHLRGIFNGRNGYLFYMEGRTGFVEQWTEELANRLVPERDMKPDWAPENHPEAGN
ncbi:MAG: glycosyltransferase family 39 protein [Candidatus Sabulitectum sp.]|nr:glycosyltransferase family 39 protein [Candidatus Sabulitectum sp.]